MTSKQTEVDSLLKKNLEAEQSKKKNYLKAQVLDIHCRCTRGNFIFYRIPEVKGETDDNCVRKLLTFMEEMLEIENATKEINLHRSHRMGSFSTTKIRQIVAKFTYYPDRENVRKHANRLRNTSFGISQQFPKDIMDTNHVH